MVLSVQHPHWHPALTLKLALTGLLVLNLAVVSGVLYFGTYADFSARGFEVTILSWGMWGVLGSIGLMIVHSLVPFPAEFLAIANGMVYGPLWGTVITWTGAMLGAFLAFGLARALGRPFVELMVTKQRWHVLDEWAAARSVYLVLLSRFIPVIAFNLVNYAAGLARISWWNFTWATGIGILPFTVMMVVLGDHIDVLSWEIWALLLVAGFFLWLIFQWRLKLVQSPENQRAEAIEKAGRKK